MGSTPTDVRITSYDGEFKRVAPFAGYSSWQITGSLLLRETVPRRRKWTVAKEFLDEPGVSEVTDEVRRQCPELVQDSADSEFRAFARFAEGCTSSGVVWVLEELPRQAGRRRDYR